MGAPQLQHKILNRLSKDRLELGDHLRCRTLRNRWSMCNRDWSIHIHRHSEACKDVATVIIIDELEFLMEDKPYTRL